MKSLQSTSILDKKSEIKFVKITYDPDLELYVNETLQLLTIEYPIVTIHSENQFPLDKQQIPNEMQKRNVFYLFLSQTSTKIKNYDKWIHYTKNQNQLDQQDGRETIKVQQVQKKEKISEEEWENKNQQSKGTLVKKLMKDTSEKLKLDCQWIGVCSRLGTQVQSFSKYLQEKQNFTSFKVSFLSDFLKYLNKLLNSPQNEPNQILFQKSFEQASQKDIPIIEEQVEKQICQNFNDRILLINITNHRYLELLRSRNYFQLLGIQETLSNRFNNFSKLVKQKYPSISSWLTFQNFIELDQYWYAVTIQKSMKKVTFTINRLLKPIKQYSEIIQQNKSFILKEFRPNFHSYFISICKVLKERAGCIKQAVGSIIVRKKRIIATGYNGTPMGSANCFNGACPVCNNNQKMNTIVLSCNCIHAEYGCIIEAGIHVTPGCILYTTKLPCLWCSKMIIQAKIKEVVYLKSISKNLEFENTEKIKNMFKQTDIVLTEFPNNEKYFSDQQI